MTTQTQQAQSPAAAAPQATETTSTTLDERLAAAFGDSSPEATVDPGASPSAEPPGVASGDESAKRAERRKAIADAMAQARAKVDAKQKQRENSAAVERAAQLERERNELAKQVAERVDVSKLDEQGFFELAERLQISPANLGKFLRERAERPDLLAAKAVEKAVDPKISALEKKLAEQAEQLEKLAAERGRDRATAEAYARGDALLSFVEGQGVQAPFAAAALKKYGPEQFLQAASEVYDRVPHGPGWEQAVLDEMENALVEHHKEVLQLFGGGVPQQAKAPPPPNRGAAQPMTTVTNTLAQTRAVVADEETEWAQLPYEERVRRTFT